MKFRLIELIFLIGVVGVVSTYFHEKSSSPTPAGGKGPAVATSATPTVSGSQVLSLGDAVPEFSLSDPAGVTMTYQAGKGPILIVLTATGCGGCLERIDGNDRQAYQLARSLEVPVWNLLVYQGVDGAAAFVDQHKPSADLVLCDRSASVSVNTLGGSDATCWLLIDGQGKLVWRGPAEMDGLKEALAKP